MPTQGKNKVPVIHLEYTGIFESPVTLKSSPEGLLTYCDDYRGNLTTEPKIEEWQKFILQMKAIPSLNSYYRLMYLLDGTQWEFYYEFEDHKIRCGGSNAGPKELKLILKNLQELGSFRNWSFCAFEDIPEEEQSNDFPLTIEVTEIK